MKKLVLISLIFINLFAQSAFKNKVNEKEIVLQKVLKGSHKNRVISFNFYNDKLITGSSDNTIKIWDLKEQELLKTININGSFKKVVFSKDGSKIYTLSSKEFAILDSKTYKVLNTIEGSSFENFALDNDSVIILFYYSKIKKYNLVTGEEVYTIKSGTYNQTIKISQNNKYMAISYSSDIKVFNLHTGEFITKFSIKDSISGMNFINNKYIGVFTSYKGYISIYNFKTEELQVKVKKFDRNELNNCLFLDNLSELLIVNSKNKTISLFDLAKQQNIKFAKLSSDTIYNGVLSKDQKYIAVSFTNNTFKIYNSNGLINIKKQDIPKVTISKEPVKAPVVVKTVEPKPVVKAKPVVVKIPAIEKTIDKAPSLLLEASTVNGIVPLEVTFTIMATDDKGIDSYYINLAGKESMSKGTPPTTLKYTFNNEGTYKVIVVVKDTNNQMTKKSITIKSREMSFSDYKNMYK